MKRIAIVSEHASPLAPTGGADGGGQNVYVAQMAKNLAGMGYEVDVFTRRDSQALPELVELAPGVALVHLPAGPAIPVAKEELLPHMEEFTAHLLERLADRPCHLLHANFFMSGLAALQVKQATGTPFVVTFHALGRLRRFHQGEADRFPDERFEIEDRIIAGADRIIAECPQDAEDLLVLYGAQPEKIAVIPCGFDPDEFSPISKPLARARLGLPPNERVILQLGRMVPRKGVDDVIRGLRRLVDDFGIQARLLVVGGEAEEPDPRLTPELGRLQAIAEEEGVAHLVTFTGRRGRDILRYYYSAADVFVTTPWYEPFGITPLEAMACGIPVVGSNVGGIKFTVEDAETGFLVPPRDPAALADRLAQLYRQPELRDAFGKRAVRRVNALFTWKQVTGSIARLYDEVLGVTSFDDEAQRVAIIDAGFEELVQALRDSQRLLRSDLLGAAELMASCFAADHKLLVAGNGGSAAEAQHLAAELVGRFKRLDRPPLPVLALNADTAVLTAWSNDAGYSQVFARQVEALGLPGDLLVGMSTSGRSANLVEAFRAAAAKGLHTLAILGGDGGELRRLSEQVILVPSSDVQRVQEVQALLLHLLCELVEEQLMASERPVAALGLRKGSGAGLALALAGREPHDA
ncbi:MAG: glycosyltransferase [Actinomycetota bacterium]|nr:glycosyltransferase [Actinomycetota bacterium]